MKPFADVYGGAARSMGMAYVWRLMTSSVGLFTQPTVVLKQIFSRNVLDKIKYGKTSKTH